MPGLFALLPSDLSQAVIDDWLNGEPLGKYLAAIIADKNFRKSDKIQEILLVLSRRTDKKALQYQAGFPMLFLALPAEMQQAFLEDTNFISQFKTNLKNWRSPNWPQASIMEGIVDKRIPLSEARTLCFDQHIPGIMDDILQADAKDYSQRKGFGTVQKIMLQDAANQDRLFGFVYFFVQWDHFSGQITVILNSQSNFEIKAKAIRALALTAPFIKNKDKIRSLGRALLKFMMDYAQDIEKDNYEYTDRLNNINQLLDRAFPYLSGQVTPVITWLQQIFLLGYTRSVLAYLETLLKYPQFKEAISNSTFFESVLDQVVGVIDDDYKVNNRSLSAVAIINLILRTKPQGLVDITLLINHLAPLLKHVSDNTLDEFKIPQLTLNVAIFEIFSQLIFLFSDKERVDLYQAISKTIVCPPVNITLFSIQFIFMSMNFSRDILNNNCQNIVDELHLKGDDVTVITIIRALLKYTLFKEHFVKSMLFSHLTNQMTAMAQDVIYGEKLEEFEQLLEILKDSIPSMTQDAINHGTWIETFCSLLNAVDYDRWPNIIDLIFNIFNQIIPLLYSTKKLAIFRELTNNSTHSNLDKLDGKAEPFLKQLATTIAKQEASTLCLYALEALEEFEALPRDIEGTLSIRWLGFLVLPRYAMQNFFEEKNLLQRLWKIVDNENNHYDNRLQALTILCSCLSLYITNEPTQIERIFAAAENNYPEYPDWISAILKALKTSFDNPAFYSANVVAEIIEKHRLFHYLITFLNNTDTFICREILKILQSLSDLMGDHFGKAMRANENLIHALMHQLTFADHDYLYKMQNYTMTMNLLALWIRQGVDLQPYLTHWHMQLGESKEWKMLSWLQAVHCLNINAAPHSAAEKSSVVTLDSNLNSKLSSTNAAHFSVSSSKKRAAEQLAKPDAYSKRKK